MENTGTACWFGSIKGETRVASHQPPAIVRSLLIPMLPNSTNVPAPREIVSPEAATATAWVIVLQGAVAVQLPESLPDVLT